MAYLITSWTSTLKKKQPSRARKAPQRYAAVDIGSNAIRFLIVDALTVGSRAEVFSKRFSLRLGKDSFDLGSFSASTSQELLSIFAEIRKQLNFYKVQHLRVIGTSAMRTAKNAPSILKIIKENFNIKIEIISGKEEAKLILEGIKSTSLGLEPIIVMDLGGGSLEILEANKGKMLGFATLALGAVRALSYYNESPEKLSQKIAEAFSSNAKTLESFIQPRHSAKTLIGTGGNIRAINKIANRFLPSKLNKSTLTRDQFRQVLDRIHNLRPSERQQKLELSADRADVILPAAHVFYESMYYFDFQNIEVPKVSLKNGIIESLIKTHKLS